MGTENPWDQPQTQQPYGSAEVQPTEATQAPDEVNQNDTQDTDDDED